MLLDRIVSCHYAVTSSLFFSELSYTATTREASAKSDDGESNPQQWAYAWWASSLLLLRLPDCQVALIDSFIAFPRWWGEISSRRFFFLHKLWIVFFEALNATCSAHDDDLFQLFYWLESYCPAEVSWACCVHHWNITKSKREERAKQ